MPLQEIAPAPPFASVWSTSFCVVTGKAEVPRSSLASGRLAGKGRAQPQEQRPRTRTRLCLRSAHRVLRVPIGQQCTPGTLQLYLPDHPQVTIHPEQFLPHIPWHRKGRSHPRGWGYPRPTGFERFVPAFLGAPCAYRKSWVSHSSDGFILRRRVERGAAFFMFL